MLIIIKRFILSLLFGACITSLQAADFPAEFQEQNISNHEWQSIRQQIIASGTFLTKDEERQRHIESKALREKNVLSGTLGLTDYIKPFNPGLADRFGYSLALSGNTLVVGAFLEDSDGFGIDGNPTSNAAMDSGAVYVFVRDSNGWRMQDYLKASNVGANDLFGSSVDIDGDLIAVGAIDEDGSGMGVNPIPNDNASFTDSGAVYVFEKLNGQWQETAYLKASNPGAGDSFGVAVSVSGRTVAVGAHLEDSDTVGINPASNEASVAAGAVYVFSNQDGEWVQDAFIKASNTDVFDLFGNFLALDGNTLVVTSRFEDSSSPVINGSQGNREGLTNQNLGAAYVFVKENGQWSQQAYLKPSNPDLNDQFGNSVDVSGDYVVIGNRLEDSASSGVNGQQFNNALPDSGAAYVYRRNSSGSWVLIAYIKAPNPSADDQFGNDVAISGNFIVIGSPQEDSDGVNNNANNRSNSGAAYVYQVNDNDVEFISLLKAGVVGTDDLFAEGVAVSGNGVAISAGFDDSDADEINGDANNNDLSNAGSVSIFQTVTTFHPLSGVVVGLADGNSVMLQNDELDTITVKNNGEFRFPGLFAEGESYTVQIAQDGLPKNPHQSCVIENGSGVIKESTVGNIIVRCTLETLSINQNINTVDQAVVNVPVQFAPEGRSIAIVVFSLDYDQNCLNPDANNDGVLDAVSFNVSNEFTTTISFDPSQENAEIDVIIADQSLPFGVIDAGNVVDIDFTVNCPESQTSNLVTSMIQFSESNPPSFSDLSGRDVEGTHENGVVRVWASEVGDCNASGSPDLTAADLASLILEIADDDGTNFIDAPESDNFGSPQGCDANSNELINVADLACLTRLLGNDACEPLRVVTSDLPRIDLKTHQEDDILWLTATMEQNANSVAAVSFSLDINPAALATFGVDYNHDDIPDRIEIASELEASSTILWNERENRIDIYLSNIDTQSNGGSAVQSIPDGAVVSIGIPLINPVLTVFELSSSLPPVFADVGGMEQAGDVTIGDVIFQADFE
ncbi:MAG: FG-GAP repeat protein [Xanthomonadales bacterium]|nr:FG-GAP repeat protein [Xanthomonadales bacterium]